MAHPPSRKKINDRINYQSLFLLLIYNTRLVVKSQGEFSKMATATINGKPNLFLSPEPPTKVATAITAEITDHQEYVERVVVFATELVADEVDPEAEMLNDPEFQESYNEWCEKLDEEWRNDPEAQRVFGEWCDEQQRLEKEAELETLEHEAYEADLERHRQRKPNLPVSVRLT